MNWGAVKHIAVIAPSGPPDRELLEAGVAAAEAAGVKISVMPDVFKGGGLKYLSSDTAARLDDLHRALNDASVDMIMCARGGYGAVHLLDKIDYGLLRERDIPVVGLSDITALHLAMLSRRAGRPWAGPMAIRLQRLLSDPAAWDYFSVLLNPAAEVEIGRITRLKRVDYAVTGLPVVANMAVLAAQCGSEFLPDFTGKILILEDIGEPLYRLDRYLSQMRLNGIFERVQAVLFGQFTDCAPHEDILKLLNQFSEALPPLTGFGFPFGHEWPTAAIDQTRLLAIDADRVRILPESAVI